jgi:hypothetical protein
LLPFNFQTPSLFYFLPFSLMPAVCLMELLPDELVTQIVEKIKQIRGGAFALCVHRICLMGA